MREITETHIIELIKKYAKGGGDLLPYFKNTSMGFYVTINNNLTASWIDCKLEDIDTSYHFRTNFGEALAVASGYRQFGDLENGDVIRSGSTFSFIEMVINEQSEWQSTMYPVKDIGQDGLGAYQIPPNSDVSSWTDSAGDTRRGLGSLLILGSIASGEKRSNVFTDITDSDNDYEVPNDITHEHDPDEVVSIGEYLTREGRMLPDSGTSHSNFYNAVTIGGTQYTIGSNSSSGLKLWITDFTLTSNLTYIADESYDPVLRASDNKLVSLEVYV